MSQAASPYPMTGAPGIAKGAYVVAGLSFVPLLGVPFGVSAMIWGLLSKRRGGGIVAALGGASLALTVVLYGALFYFGFVQHGGLYDELRAKLAQENLIAAVSQVESYKVAKGEYPDSLEAVRDFVGEKTLAGISLMDTRRHGDSLEPRLFYYRKIDADHYVLRGVGEDGDPFSTGSLTPQTPPGAKFGLVINPASP